MRKSVTMEHIMNSQSMLCIAAVLVSVVSSGLGAAPATSPSQLQLKTERVVAFKDGYALFVRTGTATCDADGQVYTENLPDSAVLGSFWATTPDGPPSAMRAGFHTATNVSEVASPCTSPLEVLKANRGRRCTLELNTGRTHSGVITEVLTRDTQRDVNENALPAYLLTASVFSSSLPVTVTDPTGTHFVLRTDEGDLLLPVSAIRELSIAEMTTSLAKPVKQTVRRKRLTLQFATPGKRRQVTLMYFRPGVRWIPTYRVTLEAGREDGKPMADVSMQAEILNEAEDLNGVPMDVVVGVPNFRFRETISPLALERVMRNALREAAPQIMGQMLSNGDFSNALFTQRASEHVRPVQRGANQTGGGVSLPSELTVGGAQDLFVYHLPPVTLKKGERTAMHLLSARVPYRDVYTWDLRIKREDNATAPSGEGSASPLRLSKNQVWHQVELENTTELPWTTGAVMFMQDAMPLAQELLTYTSPGDAVRVPITVSVDTRGSIRETELERELKALRWDNRDYAKIANQATLALVNRKEKAIDVEIKLSFGGRTDTTTPDARIVTAGYRAEDWERYRGSPAVNNSSQVIWRHTIEPGAAFEPSVTYHYFTRQ